MTVAFKPNDYILQLLSISIITFIQGKEKNDEHLFILFHFSPGKHLEECHPLSFQCQAWEFPVWFWTANISQTISDIWSTLSSANIDTNWIFPAEMMVESMKSL